LVAEEGARDERWWSSGAETTIWEETKPGRGTALRLVSTALNNRRSGTGTRDAEGGTRDAEKGRGTLKRDEGRETYK